MSRAQKDPSLFLQPQTLELVQDNQEGDPDVQGWETS